MLCCDVDIRDVVSECAADGVAAFGIDVPGIDIPGVAGVAAGVEGAAGVAVFAACRVTTELDFGFAAADARFPVVFFATADFFGWDLAFGFGFVDDFFVESVVPGIPGIPGMPVCWAERLALEPPNAASRAANATTYLWDIFVESKSVV